MNATVNQKPSDKSEGVAGIGCTDGLDALVLFLENYGEDFMRWDDGRIVIETYYDKKFRALGGDTNRLISFFEDYCNMHDASRHYIAALRKASNDEN